MIFRIMIYLCYRQIEISEGQIQSITDEIKEFNKRSEVLHAKLSTNENAQQRLSQEIINMNVSLF